MDYHYGLGKIYTVEEIERLVNHLDSIGNINCSILGRSAMCSMNFRY